MNEYEEIFASVLFFWNNFASANGYKQHAKIKNDIKRKIRSRLKAEPDFLSKIPTYFELIHRNLDGRNEFGRRLDLYEFLRSTVLLSAMRKDGVK
ncbi:MAG: hypothetical protein AB7G80_09175 [Dongiaceae bacterium]